MTTVPSLPTTTQIRDIFLDVVKERFILDSSNIILTVDMGALSFKELKSNYPDRFINIGVCEQNSVSVAAGLACAGMNPIVYGITPFLVSRAKAQLRHDISIGNKRFMLIGSGLGLSYSEDGPSHHSFDDISMIINLPNFAISTPVTQESVSHIFQFFDKHLDYSLYTRLDKSLALDNLILSSDRSSIYTNGCLILRSGLPTTKACVSLTPFLLDSLLSKYPDHDIIFPFLISDHHYLPHSQIFHQYQSVVVEDESSAFGGLFMYISTILSLYFPGNSISIKSALHINKWLQSKYNRTQSYDYYTID